MNGARNTTVRAAVLAACALVASLLAMALLSGVAPAGAATTTPADQATPLTVVLTSLTPSTVPRRGVIRLNGIVTNSSEELWQAINVAPFISHDPITTRDGLALAAATAPSTSVGDRLTDPGTYAAVGDLAPGQSAPFRIRVPVSSLLISGAEGVYWIGVHALGTNTAGRDLVADGRARTFIPLVSAHAARTRTDPISVVLPLRERARRAADGSLNGPSRWAGLTAPDGRLTRLVAFAASAGSLPLTWVVDPAVLDALGDYSQGNPPLTLGSARRGGPSTGPTPTPSPTPNSSTSAPGSPSPAERARAGAVLDAFLADARTHALLTLGYGDPDVVALARHRPALVGTADQLSQRRMKARGLSDSPVIAPPDGYFDPSLLSRVGPTSTLVLTDGGRLELPPSSRLPSGHPLVLTDERAGAGGPAPTTPHDPLALRQRVLSEAALEVTKGAQGNTATTGAAGAPGTQGTGTTSSPRPVVLALPRGWNPGARWRQADFFGGLQTPWTRLAPVLGSAGTTYPGKLDYDRALLASEIPAANVQATHRLAHTSDVLGHLLTGAGDVTDRLTGAALQASSYSARPSLQLAADQVRALESTTQAQLAKVAVTGTDFVTLSGGAGSVTVTLVNGLKQPITVGLRARTDGAAVHIAMPDPVRMEPGQRTTQRLQVTSSLGVHEVTLSPVTIEGETTGTPLRFSLRTSAVGQLIWYVILAGGLLLAVMIVRRIVLRIRNHEWRLDDRG